VYVPLISCPTAVKKGSSFEITANDLYVGLSDSTQKIQALRKISSSSYMPASDEYTFSQSSCSVKGSSFKITASTAGLDYGSYEFLLACTSKYGGAYGSLFLSPSCTVRVVECVSNADCTDPTKPICDVGNTYYCKSCKDIGCPPDKCCTASITNSDGSCVNAGNITTINGISYLCVSS